MTESGFVKAQSDNLPKIDAFMMTSFFATNPDFVSAECKGVKATRSQRESYGDSAVGYVQVKRDGDICMAKARITPEHNVRQKCYTVTVTCNEAEETVSSIECNDCAAHLGGCKHAIAFLAWLHRRSEEPSTTSVKCYWKKSKLSTVGTSLKFITAKDMYMSDPPKPMLGQRKSTRSFLSEVKNYSTTVGNTENQLMKYFREPSMSQKISIHFMVTTIPSKPTSPEDFINYCRQMMNLRSCKEAERATIEQNDCPLWHELRYARITASKAYDAAHCKIFDGTLTESIVGASKLKDTDAMKRGRLLEKQVIKEVEKIKKIKVKKCGMKLNAEYPMMGASPDGESDIFSVEVKCPSTEKTFSKYLTREGKVSSKYMSQVQLQMYFSKKNKALFCVAHSDFEMSRKVSITVVDYDAEYSKNLLEKCTMFWSNAIFPVLFK